MWCIFITYAVSILFSFVWANEKETFGVMVVDFDSFNESNQRFTELGGDEYEGMTWIDVTPGTTAGDILSLVNSNRMTKREHNQIYYDSFMGMSNDEVDSLFLGFHEHPYRDDHGLFFKRNTEKFRSNMNEYFAGVFYAGQMLGSKVTLRSAGVGPTSILFLRRYKNLNQPAASYSQVFQITDIYIKGERLNLQVQFYRVEPLANMLNHIGNAMGIPVTKLVLNIKFKHNSDRIKFTMDHITETAPVLAKSMEKFYARFKGYWPALYDEPRSLKYWTKSVRYSYTAYYPTGDLADMEMPLYVEDPLAGCSCSLGSVYTNTIAPNLSKRLRKVEYGMGCKAHDENQKYCEEKQLFKGNRKCWCPLKWCYTTKDCGVPSKLAEGVYYSFGLCPGNPQKTVDCFASDDESLDTVNLNDFDIWEFHRLQAFLKGLMAKLSIKISSWDDS